MALRCSNGCAASTLTYARPERNTACALRSGDDDVTRHLPTAGPVAEVSEPSSSVAAFFFLFAYTLRVCTVMYLCVYYIPAWFCLYGTTRSCIENRSETITLRGSAATVHLARDSNACVYAQCHATSVSTFFLRPYVHTRARALVVPIVIIIIIVVVVLLYYYYYYFLSHTRARSLSLAVTVSKTKNRRKKNRHDWTCNTNYDDNGETRVLYYIIGASV